MMMLGSKEGEGSQKPGKKSDYVIISELSLILNVTSAKRLVFVVI